MANPLTRLISKCARFVDDNIGISNLHYTFSERANLLKARLYRGDTTSLLSFKVKKMSQESFRIVLREIFFMGEYKFTAENDAPVIFDCGANIGLATLYFKYIYPKAHITAFEADPDTAQVLKENVANNHLQDVTVHTLMLTNCEGERTFYLGKQAENLKGSANPNRVLNPREVKVKAARLSRFVYGPIDLLKLDVEGSEFDVITDLITTGRIAEIKKMVIEYHHKIDNSDSCLGSFLMLLEEQGFEYQIDAKCAPISCQNLCQDILIGAYRRGAR